MPPVVAAAGIAAVATVGSAVVGSKAAKKAANAQVASDQAAIDEQRRQYDLTREDFAPWREAGGAAIKSGWDMLQPGYDYTASPGYQFRFNEGQRAIQGSAASRGGLLTGGTLKDLLGYGEGLAAQDYNDQFNRTMSVASGGQQANTTVGQLGGQAAGNIGNLLAAQGQARASGYQNKASAINTGLGNIAQIAMMPGLFGRSGGGGYSGGGGGGMGFYGENLYLGA